MSGLDWLMYANIAVWLGLGAYLAFMARTQKTLDRRLQRMEAHLEKDGADHV